MQRREFNGLLAGISILSPASIVSAASEQVATKVQTVSCIADLIKLSTSAVVGDVIVKSYHNGHVGGGGVFRWDAARRKSQHDGGQVIDPDRPYPEKWEDIRQQLVWYQAALAGAGCWVRSGTEENISPEDFGALGNGAVDDSCAITTAFAVSNAISGTRGRIYLIQNVPIARELRFIGDVVFKKADRGKSIFNISSGPYKVEFVGPTFDGSWSGGDLGEADVAVSARGIGLNLVFDQCKFQNWSRYAVSTGFPPPGRIEAITFERCVAGPSGAPKRGMTSALNAAVLYINNVASLRVTDSKFFGDGTFDLGDGSANDLRRAPAISILVTTAQVTVSGCDFHGTGGIALYFGCDDTKIVDCRFDNCLYAVSAQESSRLSIKNCKVIGTRNKYRGAITVQPYARINSATARKQEGVGGADISNVEFENNEIDISLIGGWVYAKKFGVQDTRCRNIKILNCASANAKQMVLLLQDIDDVEIDSLSVRSPCTASKEGAIFMMTASGPGGNGKIVIKNADISGEGGGARYILRVSGAPIDERISKIQFRKSRFNTVGRVQAPLILSSESQPIELLGNQFDMIPAGAIVANSKSLKLNGNKLHQQQGGMDENGFFSGSARQ